MKIVLLLLFMISLIEARFIGGKCEVSIDYRKGDLKEPQPLVLTDSKTPTFLLPNDKKILTIPTNTTIVLSCPGRRNYFENLTSTGAKVQLQSVKVECVLGKKFLLNSTVYEFSAFKCKSQVQDSVREANSSCLGEHQQYDIGFFHETSHFIKLLEICRDRSSYTTYYSKSSIPKEILGFQSSFPRPHWRYGGYYKPYNMNQLYKLSSQLRAFEVQLGSAELARKYLSPGKQFLNRGHLAAKADLVYGSQQTASFWLLNAAPQWSSVNMGNWLRVEKAVRSYASGKRRDLQVYTGVHGQSTLPDLEGKPRPLYLHAAASRQGDEEERGLPVPRFFWKLLHDLSSNRAIGFVTLNEPYAANVTKDMYVCEDVGDEESNAWIAWEPEDIQLGVSYLCSVQDLRRAIPTVPRIGEEVGLISFR